jgi:uncharacterized membrane protein
MNQAHWHLMLNHLPVVGTLLSTMVLLAGMIIKNRTVQKTASGLFILTVLFAVPAYLTGEGAEDVLESIGQKNEHFIHEHEEAAGNALWISALTGLLSIATVFRMNKQNKPSRLFMIIVLLAGITNTFLMLRVANSGGEIRHTEIREVNKNPAEESK